MISLSTALCIAAQIVFVGEGLKSTADEAYHVAQWRKSPRTYTMDGTPNGEYRAVELFQKEPSPIVVRFAGEAGKPQGPPTHGLQASARAGRAQGPS